LGKSGGHHVVYNADEHYHDDPTDLEQISDKKKLSSFVALLLLIVSGSYFVQTTLAANISLNAGGPVEFGQGVSATVACSGATNLTVTPNSTFVNASGGGAHYFSSVTVSNIPSNCHGKDFTINAYDNTESAALALFNSTSKSVVVYNNAGTFQLGIGSTGMNISSGSGTFTATFVSPVATSASVFKITIQSGSHTEVAPASGSYTFDNTTTQYLRSASTGYAATDFKRADFTIECWVYPLSNQGGWTPIVAIGSQPGGAELRIGTSMAGNNQAGALYPGGDRDATIGDVQMTANAWHHLALVRSGNTMSFYLDGVRTGYDPNALFNGVDFANTGYIYIAQNPWPGDGGFNGRVSNVRFVKGLAVYTGDFTRPSQSLTLTQGAGTNIAEITNQTTFLMSMAPGSSLVDSSSSAIVMSAVGSPTATSDQPFN
jgi:Concanavalin A-like lectin/glucanases superfamily